MSHKYDAKIAAHVAPPEQRDALWAEMNATLSARRAKPARGRSWPVVAVAASLLLALAAGSYRMQLAPPRQVAAVRTGPLHLSDGIVLPPSQLGLAGDVVQFDDKSVVRARAGTKLELLDNSAQRFAIKQSAGSAHYAVTPEGPRRWTVDTPLGAIEVVGTEFAVDADATHLRVEVAHGVVIVRGDLVPDHAKRLTAGDVLELTKPIENTLLEQPILNPAATAPTAHKVPATESLEHAQVSELFALADDLRKTGRALEAVAPLEQVIAKHGLDERAAMAAFTLGRLEMDSLMRLERAESAFAHALSLGLHGALAEDATYRRAQVLVSLARGEEATRIAALYVAKHPDARARFTPFLGSP